MLERLREDRRLHRGVTAFDPGAGPRTTGMLEVQNEGKAEQANAQLQQGPERRLSYDLRDRVVLAKTVKLSLG